MFHFRHLAYCVSFLFAQLERQTSKVPRDSSPSVNHGNRVKGLGAVSMSFATLIRRKQVHLKTLIVATRCINAYCNTLLLYVDGFDNDKLQQSVLYSATLQHNFSTDPTKDCLQNQCPCFGCNGSFFCRRKNLKSLRNRLKWTSGQFRILPPRLGPWAAMAARLAQLGLSSSAPLGRAARGAASAKPAASRPASAV